MKLSLATTDDGYQLWGVFLNGRRNDGDGGIEIHKAWFMVAQSKGQVLRELAYEIDQTIRSFTNWYAKPSIDCRPVSPGELTLCYRRPGGRLEPVSLHEKSADDLLVTAAIMDTRS